MHISAQAEDERDCALSFQPGLKLSDIG